MSAEQVDYATGEVVTAELVPFRHSAGLDRSAEGVVAILTHARQWLASAVDLTGPAEIAQAKAVIATAETYAKELHLSKEIQLDATEMVRRAEYALGKAIRKGQAEGTIRTRGERGGQSAYETVRNGKVVQVAGSDVITNCSKPGVLDLAPDFYSNGSEMSVLADADPEQVEDALAEARSEENLSRANVVRKIKGVPTVMSRKEKAERARRFRIAVAAGRYEECDIDRIVRANGCVVTQNKTHPGAISAVSALTTVYRDQGAEVLGALIRTIRDAFGDAAYESAIIRGVGLVLGRYPAIDRARFTVALHDVHAGSKGILNAAHVLRNQAGGSQAESVAAACVNVYNRSKGPKLPSWWVAAA